jgi:NNP family nitrate/nitrite transporter-like MFS transporter
MVTAGLATILIGATSGIALIVLIFIQPTLLGCFPAAGFSALARTVQPNLRSVATSLAAPTAFIIGGGLVPTSLGFMGETYTFSAGIVAMGCLIVVSPVLVQPLRLLDKLEPGC